MLLKVVFKIKFRDIVTFQNKAESRQYSSAQEFAEDLRLIFTNCYKYNPADSDVVMMAKKLQDVFEIRFARMPDEHAFDTLDKLSNKDDSGSSLGETESESGNESEEEREKKLTELQDQVSYCVSGHLCSVLVLYLKARENVSKQVSVISCYKTSWLPLRKKW